MKQENGKRSLEGLRVFPYVAWILTIGFALFVHNIATELEAVTADLQRQAASLEQKIDNHDTQADFDNYSTTRLSPSASE